MANRNKDLRGLSEGAWVSLAVKSLRIGWVEGLKAAEERLCPSKMRAILMCGVFEDIFPAVSEIAEVVKEVKELNYQALCERETHHSRGYTLAFCGMEKEAVKASKTEQAWIYDKARELGFYLPPRSLNCFYTWLKLAPNDPGKKRPADFTPFTEMPEVMLDVHTEDGRKKGIGITVLSGSYNQHYQISLIAEMNGWEAIREITFNSVPHEEAEEEQKFEQAELFL